VDKSLGYCGVCYTCLIIFFSIYFFIYLYLISSGGFSKKGRMKRTSFLVYIFSIHVLYMAYWVDLIGLHPGRFLAYFGSYLVRTCLD